MKFFLPIYCYFRILSIKNIYLILILLFLTMSLSHADDPERISQTFDFTAIESLQISNLEAQLSIETGLDAGIQLNLTGSKRQLEALHIEQQEQSLLIIYTPPQTSVQSLNISSSTVIVSGGGRASVTINGQPVDTTQEPPLEAKLTIGSDIPITLSNFVGTAQIGALSAPLDLELLNGTAELTAVNDTNVHIRGSGTVNVHQASGAMDIAVRGAGTVKVNDAQLSKLSAAVQGAGDISIQGQAHQAKLTLKGAGSIYVQAVDQEPQLSVAGVGTIKVGNW